MVEYNEALLEFASKLNLRHYIKGMQVMSWAWCVEYSPPPRPPPPMPPPPSPPPKDVCSAGNMAVGCKCASQGFGHGLPDNPPSTSPLCCDKATKRTITGAQLTSFVTCVEYSPPPRPPPPMPPPPMPPPADVCSSGNFFAGCKKCGDSIGVNCPPVNTGLCCHKTTRVTVTGARATTTNWCASSVAGPSQRRLLSSPSSPEGSIARCCNANHADELKLITAAQCCDTDTLTLVDGGAQCTSTRWCRAKDCIAAPKIPRTKKCAAASTTPAVLPPPPPPLSGIPNVTAPAPAPAAAPAPVPSAQCCNANGDDWKSVTAGECCDPDTLSRMPGGKQCMSSRWCNLAVTDCNAALLIDGAKTAAGGCLADSPAPAPEADDDFSANSTNATTNLTAAAAVKDEVGRCRLTVSCPMLHAPMISALETET